MFSGLTSMADLNQQFLNFTNTITNLDTMQNSSTEATTSEQGTENVTISIDETLTKDGTNCKQSLETKTSRDTEYELEIIQSKYTKISIDFEKQSENLKIEQQKVVELELVLENTKKKHAKHLQVIESENDSKIKQLESDMNILQKSCSEKAAELELIHQQKSVEIESASASSASNNKGKWKKLFEEETAKNRKLQYDVDDCQRKLKEMELLISDQSKWRSLYEQEVNKADNLQSKLDSNLHELKVLEDKSKQLEIDLHSALCSVDRMKIEQSTSNDEQNAIINQLKSKILDNDQKYVKLNEENDKYIKKVDVLNAKCVEYEKQISLDTESLKLNQSEKNKATSQLEELRILLETKEKICSEMESKNHILTEKLKEIMQKYAEFKSKSSNNSQHSDEQMNELKKKLQDKDSEILSLRLKMENFERTISDSKLKILDLTERYSENQRELATEQELLEAKTNVYNILEISFKNLEKENSKLQQENDEISKHSKEIKEKYYIISSSHKDQERMYNEKIEKQEFIYNQTINELQSEINSLNIRLKSESESSGNLDSYKKRAQIALKKANNATSLIAKENEALREDLEENARKLLEFNELLKVANQNQHDLKENIYNLKLAQETIVKQHEIDISFIQEKLNQALNELQVQYEEVEKYKIMNQKKNIEESLVSLQLPYEEIIKSDNIVDDNKSNVPLMSNNINTKIETSFNEQTEVSSLNKEDFMDQNKETWAITTSRANSILKYKSTDDSVSENTSIDTANIDPDSMNKKLNALEQKDFAMETSSDYLFLVSELQQQSELLKKELAQRGIDIEAARQELQYEKDEKRILSNKIEELIAFIDRAKRLNEGPDSTINMEYLKNCIFKYMCSTELSERKRLYPVISTILKLTNQELASIENAFAISEQRENELENTFTSITTTIGSLWSR